MANATPPNPDRPHIVKGPVQARQGQRGTRVLTILAVSLALLAIAYFLLHGYFAQTPHQDVSASPRPILAAVAPVAGPTMATAT